MRRLMLCEKYFLPKPNKPKKGHGEVLLQSTVAERCHDSERPLPVMRSLANRKGKRHFSPLERVAPFSPPAKLRHNPFCEFLSPAANTQKFAQPAERLQYPAACLPPHQAPPPCSLSGSAKIHGPLYFSRFIITSH